MPKTKSADKFPLDIKGEMIFLGSIICVPILLRDDAGNDQQILRLGFVSKMTQKNGIDVTLMNPVSELEAFDPITGNIHKTPKKVFKTSVFRIKYPAREVNVIDRETLKTRDDYHEALRMASGLIT
jgi:hypothetical protein